jgi:site-specific recombinase XerD
VLEEIMGRVVKRPELIAFSRLRKKLTPAIIKKLAGKYRPPTVNLLLASWRGVMRQCWRMELMSREDLERAIDLPRMPYTNLPKGKHATANEKEALFLACRDDSALGARDAALLALGFGCGLRRREISDVLREDVDLVGQVLKVHGKGRRERAIPIDGIEAELAEWIAIRGDNPGPLLLPVVQGQFVFRRLSERSVWDVLYRRAKQAGIDHMGPHDMRKSFITDLLEQGVDEFVVQRLAGHRTLDTTAIYDLRGIAESRRALRSLRLHAAADRNNHGRR